MALHHDRCPSSRRSTETTLRSASRRPAGGDTGGHTHLIDVPDVDVHVGCTEQSDPQRSVEGPQGPGRGAVPSSWTRGRLRGATAETQTVTLPYLDGDSTVLPVGRCDEAGGRKLRIEAVFGHQHQVRKTADNDAGADVLQTHREVRQPPAARQAEDAASYLVLTERVLLQEVLITATHLRRQTERWVRQTGGSGRQTGQDGPQTDRQAERQVRLTGRLGNVVALVLLDYKQVS